MAREEAVRILSILESAKDKNGAIPMSLVRKAFEKLPSAQPEIIRCKDCKHFERNIPCVGGQYDGCEEWLDNGNESCVDENDFCSRAERREDETD